MSKLVVWTIVGVVEDDANVEGYHPRAIETKDNWYDNFVETTVTVVNRDWLEQVEERVDGEV